MAIKMIGCSAPYVESVERRVVERFGDGDEQPNIILVYCDSDSRWETLQAETEAKANLVVAVLPDLDLDMYIKALTLGADGVVYADTSSAITVDVINAAVHGEIVLPRQAAHDMALLARRLKPTTQLTPPETELLKAVAAGRTIVDLARETYFSERTVRRHLQSLYLKLGVQNRAEAIAAAARMDIAD